MKRWVFVLTAICVVILGSLTAALLLKGRPVTSGAQPQSTVTDVRSWVLNDSLGFPFWTALNLEWPRREGEHREVFVWLERTDFREESLRRLFESIAARYREPSLSVYVRTDREALIELAAISAPLSVHYNHGSTGRNRQKPNTTEDKDRGLWADYTRMPRRDGFRYSDPVDSRPITVDLPHLKFPWPPYTGDVDKDLLESAVQGNTSRIREVLGAGANPDARDKGGSTPLMLSIWFRNKPAFDLLMTAGASRTAQNDEGWTPTHFASITPDIEFLRDLLAVGVDVNVANRFGNTPLMLAAGRGFVQHVKLLIASEANKQGENVLGETALSKARDEATSRLLRDPTR